MVIVTLEVTLEATWVIVTVVILTLEATLVINALVIVTLEATLADDSPVPAVHRMLPLAGPGDCVEVIPLPVVI